MYRLSVAVFFFLISFPGVLFSQEINFSRFTIVNLERNPSNAEKAAALILSNEVEKRTGLKALQTNTLTDPGNIILLQNVSAGKPFAETGEFPVLVKKPESFTLSIKKTGKKSILTIRGFDARGVLFGAGKLLRIMKYRKGSIGISNDLFISESPDKAIRGHQLGYRNTANSYDAWTPEQYDQYIRELAIFGCNSVEVIPIFKEEKSPHFKLAPEQMNARISAICEKYDQDFWIWVPAQFDLADNEKRKNYLDEMEKICKSSVRLNGIFFPGGDPGDNPPSLVLPLLKDIAVIVAKYHPEALTWLSLQGYTPVQCREVYIYIQQNLPPWLGGLITGPSSPPIEDTRRELPSKYKVRYYPDLTHNVRCDTPVPWWDPAFNFTLGREAVNPRPNHYAAMYRQVEPYLDGFISYSDGVHDDVNKITWSALSWNRNVKEREMLVEYANFFFGTSLAVETADAILALESNWQGPIATNGSIPSTWETWNRLSAKYPLLLKNWRWQMYLMRACYDLYVRDRSEYENSIEEKANQCLLSADKTGAEEAMQHAAKLLSLPDLKIMHADLRNRIIALCDSLFRSIGLQTSVKRYQASGEERGAVLDFLDRPLNNRWWLEDQFTRIRKLPEKDKITALHEIARWENPGPGSYYDDAGNVSKSPHVMRGEGWATDPLMRKADNPGYDWWENGFSRQRLSWMSNMRWPPSVEYSGLDSASSYLVRITGYGESLLKVNGQRVEHTKYGKGIGELKEFPVPQELLKTGHIVLTWQDINEDSLNWRQQSRVTEVWLIRQHQ